MDPLYYATDLRFACLQVAILRYMLHTFDLEHGMNCRCLIRCLKHHTGNKFVLVVPARVILYCLCVNLSFQGSYAATAVYKL